MSETRWQVGQRVVIDRDSVATVEKVSPSGRATIGGRVYRPDGLQMGRGNRWRASRIEAATPELLALIALRRRHVGAHAALSRAISAAERFDQNNRPSTFRPRDPDSAAVKKAARDD